MHHGCSSDFGLGGRGGKIEENKPKINSVGIQLSYLVPLQLPNMASKNKAREHVHKERPYVGSSMLSDEGKYWRKVFLETEISSA